MIDIERSSGRPVEAPYDFTKSPKGLFATEWPHIGSTSVATRQAEWYFGRLLDLGYKIVETGVSGARTQLLREIFDKRTYNFAIGIGGFLDDGNFSEESKTLLMRRRKVISH